MNDVDAKRGAVIGAAWHLNEFLKANVGHTKDWPLQILWDDPVAAEQLTRLLTDLNDALKSLPQCKPSESTPPS